MSVIQLVGGPKAGKEFRSKHPDREPDRFFHVLDVGISDDGAYGASLEHIYERGDDGRYHYRETVEATSI